jgi:hypothetical protein
MVKKVLIGLLAIVGVIAISQVAADAATCLQWRTIAGSSTCVVWATKGVQVEVTFRDGCFSSGEGGAFQDCRVTVSASGNDSFAFCGSAAHPVKVACNQPFSFGPTSLGVGTANTTCVEHPDNESAAGEANEKHHCVATATLDATGAQAACDTCCAAASAGACLDLTPVEMQTEFDATYFGGGNEVPPCTPGAPGCNIQQTCSINPKKITFITDPSQGREYQCNTDCVGDACFTID